jgi:1-acyl-sn-glycerol-3-phosphate acyltransferase
VVATVFFVFMSVAMSWVLLFPRGRPRWALDSWAAADLLILRVIVGQRTRVLGRENIPAGPALVAAKHQAAWETMALLPLLPSGRIILKKELLSIPLYGAFARHFGMIAVDRSAGAAALKQLATDAEAVLAQGAQIVIFPEGTRRTIGAPPDYKPGAIFLYDKLGVPMVPVALNSGLLWPRGRFVRYPGTVTVSFLPAIPPGIDRKVAQRRLIDAIETETARLVANP